MQITNYDVLICASEDESFRLFNEDHVGNKRFEVFLNLHREGYAKAINEGNQEEMDRIVGKIVDIVCHKCIPNGRFLEKVAIPVVGEDDWIELGEGQLARLRLHSALGGATEKVPSRSSKVFSQTQAEQKVDKGASKRRRRGSYARLRRSISESMLFHSTVLSKTEVKTDESGELHVGKDLFTRTFGHGDDHGDDHDNNHHQEDPLQPFPAPVLSGGPTKSMQPMDVVFTASRNGLVPNGLPGNARFEILVAMHEDQFQDALADERQEIVNEMKTTVTQHWKGTFLVSSFNGCQEMSEEAIEATLTSMLLGSKTDVEAPVLTNPFDQQASEAVALLAAQMSASAPSLDATSNGSVPSWTHNSMPMPNHTSSMPTETASLATRFTSSLSDLASSTMPDAAKHRNAAIEALKAKKAKKDIMNRIGKKR